MYLYCINCEINCSFGLRPVLILKKLNNFWNYALSVLKTKQILLITPTN